MHARSYVASQGPLPLTLFRMFARRNVEGFDFIARHQREEPQVATDVAIVRVNPELIEFVGRGQLRVEPYRSRFRLAEFGTGRGGYEREGDAVRLGRHGA